MIIYFLQTRTPPILPQVEEMNNQKNTHKTYNFQNSQNFKSNNVETVGELLIRFFKFYAYYFDFSKLCISACKNKMERKIEGNPSAMCIEDPITGDLCAQIPETVLKTLKEYFINAERLLIQGESLTKL